MPNRTELVDLPILAKMKSAKPTMIIPFADGAFNTNLSYSPNHTSSSEYVQVCGFGNCNNSSNYCLGTSVNPLTQELVEYVGSRKNSSTGGSRFDFSVVTDIVRATIYFDVILGGTLSATTIPYVALGVATPSGDLFKIIPETISTTPSIPSGTTAGKVFSGSIVDVSVDIPRGSRIAIICGYTTTGTTNNTSTTYLNFSGGVALY